MVIGHSVVMIKCGNSCSTRVIFWEFTGFIRTACKFFQPVSAFLLTRTLNLSQMDSCKWTESLWSSWSFIHTQRPTCIDPIANQGLVVHTYLEHVQYMLALTEDYVQAKLHFPAIHFLAVAGSKKVGWGLFVYFYLSSITLKLLKGF